jgi:hypothetical protein
MKKLVLTLSLILSSTAIAHVAECVPRSDSGSPNDVASKAFLNRNDNTITIILNNGKSVSGALVRTINQGPTAIGFSPADVERTDLSVTVVSYDGQELLLISPQMSMSIPQQLVCR